MAIDEKVNITATADTSQAITALQAIDASLQKIANQGAATQAKVDSMFDKGVSGVQAFAAGLGVATTATGIMDTSLRAVVRGIEDYMQQLRAAEQQQLSFADSHRHMSQVLDPSRLASATSRTLNIAAATGVRPEVASAAAEQLLGSVGSLPQEHALRALEVAAQYRPGPRASVEELSGIGNAILSMQRSDKTVTAEAAMQFLQGGMQASRINEIQPFAVNFMPSILRARGYGQPGDNLADLTAEAVAVGLQADDPHGRKVGTGYEGYRKQVKLWTAPFVGADASIEQQNAFLYGTERGRKLRQEKLGPMFGGGDLADLSESEQMRVMEQVYGADVKIGFKGETKTFMPLINRLREDPQFMELMKSVRGQLSDEHDPAAAARMAANERTLNRSPYQQTAITERALSAFTSSARVDNENAQANMAAYQEALQTAGVSWPVRQVMGLDLLAAGGTQLKNTEYMRHQLSRVRAGETSLLGGAPDPAMAQKLDALIGKMDAQIELLRNPPPQTVNINLGDGPTERGQIQAAQRAGQN